LCIIQAEELIKKEMLVMMHYDAVKNPTLSQMGVKDPNEKRSKPTSLVNEGQYINFLQRHPYDNFKESEINYVSSIKIL